jgi:hypothetical protein
MIKNLKAYALFICFVASILNLKAQTTEAFSAGYYIINSTAQYAVVMPSGQDFYPEYDGAPTDTFGNPNNMCYFMSQNIRMAIGEVVYVFEFNKGKYYCYDPNGRMVVFQGANCLTKASVVAGAGVGEMEEDIQILGGNTLEGGAYYWIIGQNLANSTIKIQYADGQTFDIPQVKITLYSDAIKTIMKSAVFINIE